MEILLLLLYLLPAMLLHELGHLTAARACGVRASELSLGLGPRLVGTRLCGVTFSLRLLPLGSFVRLNGMELRSRPRREQLLIHSGGVVANALGFALAYGTPFGWMNLLLVVANILPLYQHDGWKCGLVIVRSLLKRESRPVEWVYTLSGGVASVALVQLLARALL